MSLDLNPRRSVSTRNPRTLSAPPSPAPSSFAHTTATSAIDPEVIHIFSPFKMYSSPDLRARVVMPAGFDPNPDSVNPKQPSFSPVAKAGSQVFFCSSDPEGQDGIHHQRRLHTDKAAQTRVAALQLLQHQAILDIRHAGAAVALDDWRRRSPACPSRATSSRGKRPSRKQSSMMGTTFASTKSRVVRRTRSSSSVKLASSPRKSKP